MERNEETLDDYRALTGFINRKYPINTYDFLIKQEIGMYLGKIKIFLNLFTSELMKHWIIAVKSMSL